MRHRFFSVPHLTLVFFPTRTSCVSIIDPHPGNMLRTSDGKLAILDFGLMTDITDDQKYGMVGTSRSNFS